ncbi:hypothetical protein [Streptomyces sp. PT12]|uniref:hypothetical protein n=1 Tax=Streptomyces sp. PT12 TaxID=1510197 RepID=UPI00215CACE6|nr:hypothetical protein [Streptomyces sp. PT12]
MFPAATAADAFGRAHEWIAEHDIVLVDVSWSFDHDEDEPHVLSAYSTFEPDPEDD